MGYWLVLVGFGTFCIGLAVGVVIAYRLEHKNVEELLKRCKETNERMESMLKQEEDFMNSMWPKQNPHISTSSSVADYLKEKYLASEIEDEDEWDNTYN